MTVLVTVRAPICHHRRHRRANESIFLYAFDLIELNGDDLRRDPLEVRKATLAAMERPQGPDTLLTSRLLDSPNSKPRPHLERGSCL